LFSDSSTSLQVDESSVHRFTGPSLKIKLQDFWLKEYQYLNIHNKNKKLKSK
jgi:hypothetical protein